MLRAFLFDIGNVILRFDFHIALRRLAAQSDSSDPTELLTRLDPVKFMLEDGQIDRATFVRGAIDALRYRGTEADFVSAFQDIFEENKPISALIEKLSATHPLYLLSNTNDIHVDFFTRQYPVFRHFSGGTYSHRARASKPHPEIYRIACRELGLEPTTTFFIDDLLPNIETARSLGFQTHHYHHERHGELLTALAAAGVPAGL
jgi:putative hydrolase of the HAD superfamily